ncbi:MAG: hypothetical protein ACR2MX_09235 [Cyclobacteriaceae bacterium]
MNARKEEVDNELEAFGKKVAELVARTGRDDIVNEKEQRDIRLKLDTYFHFRNRQMEDGLKILDDKSSDGLKIAEAWMAHYRKAGTDSSKMILDLVSDTNPNDPFAGQVRLIASSESAFFKKLAHLGLAKVHGNVNSFSEKFEREKKSLQGKWEDLLRRDQSIDSRMKATLKELIALFEKALREVFNANREAKDKFRNLVYSLRKADEASNPGAPSVFEPLDKVGDTLTQLAPSANTIAGRYRSHFRSEETVFVIFKDTRKSVEEFLENTNLEKAVNEFEDVRAASLNAVASFAKKGHQDDGKRFVEVVAKKVEDHLKEFEDVYESFIDKFKDIFIGPVGSKTVSDLVDKELWDGSVQEWQRLNIQSELKKIYSDAEGTWGVSMDGIPAEERKKLEAVIKKQLNDLSILVREVTDWTTSDHARFIFEYVKKNPLSLLY